MVETKNNWLICIGGASFMIGLVSGLIGIGLAILGRYLPAFEMLLSSAGLFYVAQGTFARLRESVNWYKKWMEDKRGNQTDNL